MSAARWTASCHAVKRAGPLDAAPVAVSHHNPSAATSHHNPSAAVSHGAAPPPEGRRVEAVREASR